MEGAETPDTVMGLLGLTAGDKGADQIPEILDAFVPVVSAWKVGSCGGACSGCGKHA
jgi:hypothetical protein